MPKLTEAEVEEFLAGPRICRVGCVDASGFPYVVPCIYLFERGAFYLIVRARALWGEYLEQDGRCFLCIELPREGPDPHHWNKRVLVKGQARLLDGPRACYRRDDPMAQHAFRIGRRYLPEGSTDDDCWRGIEARKDVGFRLFEIQPMDKLMSWRGMEYAARYRNVYTAT
jgi:nitroimidazol reductase NimA-like FMN-containing flavoprotein (pyridoxamine 5'-phosphate oxidase superfamily)